jgi:ATP synthase protein I
MIEPDDIKAINKKISEFKQKHKLIVENNDANRADYHRSAVGFQISAELIAGVLVGAGIGYLLDILLGTKPWLLAIFIIFGGAAGMLNIYKSFKAEDKSKE